MPIQATLQDVNLHNLFWQPKASESDKQLSVMHRIDGKHKGTDRQYPEREPLKQLEGENNCVDYGT